MPVKELEAGTIYQGHMGGYRRITDLREYDVSLGRQGRLQELEALPYRS